MAFENLFIRRGRGSISLTGGRRGKPLKVDGLIREEQNHEVRVTSNPIESGVQVSDHAIRTPMRYVMEGVFTDTPLGLAAFQQLAGTVVDVVSGLFGKSTPTGLTRSLSMYDALIAMMESHQLLTVQTSFRVYDDLIMESLNVQRDKDSSRSIRFTARFVQVIIVSREIGLSAEAINGLGNKAAYASKVKLGSISSNQVSSSVRDSLRLGIG